MNPTKLIDKQIEDFPDWRGKMIAKLRKLIHKADPEIIEEWKWGTGVWSHNGMVCAIGAFKDHIKINFFKGALLADVHKLFNSGLESKQHRSIDFYEHDAIDEEKIVELIKVAVSKNNSTN